MKRALVAALVLAPGIADACPACASESRFSGYHLILLVLPILVGAIAARAIVRAMRG